MSIQHPPIDATSDEAFVFAELGGFTCSICAPGNWDVDRVIEFAEGKFPSGDKARWVSVNKAELLGVKGETPNPCNHAKGRWHYFMMRGDVMS